MIEVTIFATGLDAMIGELDIRESPTDLGLVRALAFRLHTTQVLIFNKVRTKL